jgi:hypothetical protein
MASSPSEISRDPQRRRKLRTSALYGIDYIEVSDDRLTLSVFFIGKVSNAISASNVRISGGVHVRDIRVLGIQIRDLDYSENDNCLEVAIDRPGDLSTYTLGLVELDENDQPTDQPPAGCDPRFNQADFSFNIGRVVEFDCKPTRLYTQPELPAPEINYLAKDYGSFRQLILDRLAVTVPDWQERHIPDIGIALVEILAYAGDYLSYYQDAVATEAYLNTARQRISVRRHVRLIDYAMHEGCNARAWIFVESKDNDTAPLDPSQIQFLAGRTASDTGSGLQVGAAGADIFEPVTREPIILYKAHNRISFYTWGDRRCSLEAGATSATLFDDWQAPATNVAPTVDQPDESRGRRKRATKSAAVRETVAKSPPLPPQQQSASPSRERKLQLRRGDLVLFEEVLGPITGSQADADPAHRHVVRLTEATQDYDPLFDQPVLRIRWAAEDALPFELSLPGVGSATDGGDIGVARGNVILADHGSWTATDSNDWTQCEVLPDQIPGKKYRPVLKHGPLTFCQPVASTAAAAGALLQDPRSAVPQIRLFSIPPTLDGSKPLFTFADLQDPLSFANKLANSDDSAWRVLRSYLPSSGKDIIDKLKVVPTDAGAVTKALVDGLAPFLRSWSAQRDLIASGPRDFHFVIEMDDAGYAHLRFGDGQLGRAPEQGEVFAAMYRTGIGASGNLGAETINQIIVPPDKLNGAKLTPRNPLAATGGTDPEPIDKIRLFAPKALQGELMRAVSADDYAAIAARDPRVQRAAAELRWTGIRYEAHVAIDPLGTEQADPALLRRIETDLLRYRRIGHDVIVVPPSYVPLDVAITVKVRPGYVRSHVEAALSDNFSNRALPGGRRGIFHPDNLSFGDNIYVSKLIAAAQSVAGVESVAVTRLERRFAGPDREIENGVLKIGPLEVARLDNDRVRPENGRLVLTLRGGQ